jgi:DNA-binding GntR family transcriptional regulator
VNAAFSSSWRSVSGFTSDRPAAAVAEIRAIVEAIEARDGEAAARACERHLAGAAASGLEALADDTFTLTTPDAR